MIGRLERLRRRAVLGTLWLRHAWWFHFAHKPLCRRFRGDVLHVGRLYVCRSCTMAYAGLLLGGLACGLVAATRPGWFDLGMPIALAVLGSVTVAMSMPGWYGRWPRPLRDVLRFSLGVTLATCAALVVAGQWLVGLLGAAVLLVCWAIYKTLRQARRQHNCDGCGELTTKAICSGYRRQARAVRRYETIATERLFSDTIPPELAASIAARAP